MSDSLKCKQLCPCKSSARFQTQPCYKGVNKSLDTKYIKCFKCYSKSMYPNHNLWSWGAEAGSQYTVLCNNAVDVAVWIEDQLNSSGWFLTLIYLITRLIAA